MQTTLFYVGKATGVLKEVIINDSKAEKGMELKFDLQNLSTWKKTRPTNCGLLKVDDQEYERAREFKYLSSTLREWGHAVE
jgi:hypothetical protein